MEEGDIVARICKNAIKWHTDKLATTDDSNSTVVKRNVVSG